MLKPLKLRVCSQCNGDLPPDVFVADGQCDGAVNGTHCKAFSEKVWALVHEREKWEEAVTGPGKFEGCSPWVPHFYEIMLSGCADEEYGPYFGMTVSEGEIDIFPELKVGDVLWFYQSDYGFIYEVDEDAVQHYIEETSEDDCDADA